MCDRSKVGSIAFVILALATLGSRPQVVSALNHGERSALVPGEVIVRLNADFPDCAHCIVTQGRSFGTATGSRILDQIRLRYGIAQIDLMFLGGHASDSHGSAGRTRAGHGTLPQHALDQIYLIHALPTADAFQIAQELRRDAAVLWAEPNYLYRVNSSTAAESAGHDMRYDSVSRSTTAVGAVDLPNDPFLHTIGSWGQDFADLWGLFRIEAPRAWEVSQGEGVIVAVVDTGLDIGHPDIADNVWRNEAEIPDNGQDDDGNGYIDDVYGWDFTTCARRSGSGACLEAKERGADVSDPVGHGTHVSGTIAAVGNNGLGIVGVAPLAQVMPVKGLDRSGPGSSCDLAEALVYAADNGADVINASWSGPPSEMIEIAVQYVTTQTGAVIVTAAGNGGSPLERGVSPANLPRVVTVGATTPLDEQSPSSNFGGSLDLAAPGGGGQEPGGAVAPNRSILSLLAHGSDAGVTCNFERCDESDPDCPAGIREVCSVAPWVVGQDYVRMSGTSMATAQVSGAVALLVSHDASLTAAQVRQALRASAEDLGTPGWDPNFGHGLLNVNALLRVSTLPAAEILTPENRAKIRERDLPYQVRGTALGADGTLSWSIVLRPEGSGHEMTVASGTNPVEDGILTELTSGAHLGLIPGTNYALELRVNDGIGNVSDERHFLVPLSRFAVVPVLDPFDEGAGRLTMSRDGTRVALTRANRATRNADVWWFDVPSHTFGTFANAFEPRLSPDGNFLLYIGGSSTDRISLLHDFALNRSTALYGLPLGRIVAEDTISNASRQIGIISRERLDPGADNSDGSFEVFRYERSSGLVRQVTRGPVGERPPEVRHLTITPDGRWIAFSGIAGLDPTALRNNETFEIFLYDNDAETLQQLTDVSATGDSASRPSVSDDGRHVAYYSGQSIFEVDTVSGTTQLVVADSSVSSAVGPIISADGSMIAYVAALDLDQAVGNNDLLPEVFLQNVVTRSVQQVTDTIDDATGPGSALMSGSGDVFLLDTIGPLSGLGVLPPTVQMVPSRETNGPPRLLIPNEVISAAEGRHVVTTLVASDPDDDPIVFHVERIPSFPERLRDLARSALFPRSRQTADLEFTPRFDEAGTYRLRVAAFDGAGGVDVRDIQLKIEDREPEGDANCDEVIDPTDLPALIAKLFGEKVTAMCETADVNVDGGLSAADIPGLLLALSWQ